MVLVALLKVALESLVTYRFSATVLPELSILMRSVVFSINTKPSGEDNYGNYIRADMLSQGNINGFPLYRLKWNGVGSTHRRFRGCMKNIRATPLPYGHEDYVALELYTAWRGNGLKVEAPAYRN